METPTSVVGCSTCGALYTPVRGDQGVCRSCRVTVREDVRDRPLPPPPFEREEPVARIAPPRPARRPGAARAVKRVLAAGIAAAVLLAGGLAALKYGRKPLEDAWSAMRRHGASGSWSAVQRRAANVWVAIRREIPIERLQPGHDAPADPSPGAPVRDPAKSGGARKGARTRAKR